MEVEAKREAGMVKRLKMKPIGRGGGRTTKLPRDLVTPDVPKKMKSQSGPPFSNRKTSNSVSNWQISKTKQPNCVV
jgi:hypothetical protein